MRDDNTTRAAAIRKLPPLVVRSVGIERIVVLDDVLPGRVRVAGRRMDADRVG